MYLKKNSNKLVHFVTQIDKTSPEPPAKIGPPLHGDTPLNPSHFSSHVNKISPLNPIEVMPPMSNKPVYLLNGPAGLFHNIRLLLFPLSKLVLKAALASTSQGRDEIGGKMSDFIAVSSKDLPKYVCKEIL